MENYFNYFTEIEEYYWKKRGTAMLLTTLDWALIDAWKQAEVPITAILQGIDRTFEKYDARSRKTRKMRRINSLAYCHQAVLEAAEEQKRGALPHAAAPPPFPREALAEYLGKNAAAIEKAAERFAAQGRMESAANLRAIAASLAEQAALARAPAANVASVADAPLDLQQMEQRMSVLEEKMFAILTQAISEEDLVATRAERDRQLAPFRSKMAAEQLRQLEKQFELRKLLQIAELPRLSLFYL